MSEQDTSSRAKLCGLNIEAKAYDDGPKCLPQQTRSALRAGAGLPDLSIPTARHRVGDACNSVDEYKCTIMRSERSQTGRGTCCMTPFICQSFEKDRSIEMENGRVARGWRWGERLTTKGHEEKSWT